MQTKQKISRKHKKKRINQEYKSTSGSILKKVDFANKICEEIKLWDDLTDETKILTEKIYEFIENSNK